MWDLSESFRHLLKFHEGVRDYKVLRSLLSFFRDFFHKDIISESTLFLFPSPQITLPPSLPGGRQYGVIIWSKFHIQKMVTFKNLVQCCSTPSPKLEVVTAVTY